jgi:hypothetical protein
LTITSSTSPISVSSNTLSITATSSTTLGTYKVLVSATATNREVYTLTVDNIIITDYSNHCNCATLTCSSSLSASYTAYPGNPYTFNLMDFYTSYNPSSICTTPTFVATVITAS